MSTISIAGSVGRLSVLRRRCLSPCRTHADFAQHPPEVGTPFIFFLNLGRATGSWYPQPWGSQTGLINQYPDCERRRSAVDRSARYKATSLATFGRLEPMFCCDLPDKQLHAQRQSIRYRNAIPDRHRILPE